MKNKISINLKKLFFILTFFMLTSCIQSTYYLGQFDIYVGNNDIYSKQDVVNKIKKVAQSNSLTIDDNKSNEDTLTFYGPPYHYIQFYFDNKTIQDSLFIKLVYDGRLASQSVTDKIYFKLIRQIDSLYKGRIKYNQIDKR